MKEQWSISKEKLASVEEGEFQTGEPTTTTPVTRGICYQLIQCVKLILYVELVLFVGWAGYSTWQTYRIKVEEVKARDMMQESQNTFDQKTMQEPDTVASAESRESEFLSRRMDNVLETIAAMSRKNMLENSDDIFARNEAIDMAPHVDSPKDLKRIPVLTTDSNNKLVIEHMDSSFLSALGIPDEIKSVADETFETSESKEKEKEDVMVWTFPFQWSIHGLEHEENSNEDAYESKETLETTEVTEDLVDCDDTKSEESEYSDIHWSFR